MYAARLDHRAPTNELENIRKCLHPLFSNSNYVPVFIPERGFASGILSPSCHESKNNAAPFQLKENGVEYIIASPGYPLSYPKAAM